MSKMYREKLNEMITKNGFKMDLDEWKTLSEYITQEVLDDGYQYHNEIEKMFENKLKLISRKVKKIERTNKKLSFKKNCDCVAFRIPSKISELEKHLEILCQTITENNGQYIVRTNKNPDIVIFVYGYFPNGYVIEFQIAHPFAIWTFTQDSLIRDLREQNQSEILPIDIWDNDNYTNIKNHILGIKEYDYMTELNKLYNNSIPEELITSIEY